MSDEPNESSVKGYRDAIEAIGAVVAPVTVATALAYYIGLQRQQALADGLGIEISVLGLSTQDYVVRSTDTLVRFITVLLIAVMISLIGSVAYRTFLIKNSWQSSRIAGAPAIAVGVLLLLYAVARLFNPTPLTYRSLLAPVALMFGTLAITVGLAHGGQQWARELTPRESRWIRTTVAISTAGLILAGLFWAANDYAYLQGAGRASSFQETLSRMPDVAIYSSARLFLTSDSIQEEQLSSDRGVNTYRYRGFRLLLRSDGNYFLIPHDWSEGDRQVVVVPQDRVEWIVFES